MSELSGSEEMRLAELVAAASLATDLGMGQPMEQALRTCLIATRLGERADLDPGTLGTVYYVALLRYLGCTADAAEAAQFFGDDIAPRADYARIDAGSPRQLAGWLLRHAGAGSAPPQRAVMVAAGVAMGRRGAVEAHRAHCEVARRLAARLGLPEDVRSALGQAFERWDGRGLPDGIAGEEVALPARLVSLARDTEVLARAGGAEAALAVARERSGGAYDPALVELLGECGGELLAEVDRDEAWEAVLAAEPGEPLRVAGEAIGEACRAMADFADLKSPFTRGHSPGVAELAEAAGWRLGMGEEEVRGLRHAALLHDLGRVGVSNAIWDKRGALGAGEWERVRLRPYYTERILARPVALAPLAPLASAHHERLDGSGYHRGSGAAQLDRAARVLAAADVHQALGEERPHRPAHDREAAAEELRGEVRAGRLDADAANAVLEAAGHRGDPVVGPLPAGLTEREAEVLVLLARGRSNRQIGRELGISPKTVGRHVEHVYGKASVSTRAGAALFAMEHGLLR